MKNLSVRKMEDYFGVVLAAGFGTRLQPLTETLPKPLVPFLSVPLLYLNLNRLVSVGLNKFAVNAHYLSEQIVGAVEAFPHDVEISCSIEKTLLGTAGAYTPMARFRKGKDVLAVNGDIVTDFDFESIVQTHEKAGATATMGLRPEPHALGTKIWVRDSRVVGIGEKPEGGASTPHGFACVQVLSDGFLEKVEGGGHRSIIDFYHDALQQGEVIAANVQNCFWFDLGTWGDFWEAHRAYLLLLSRDPKEMDLDRLGVFSFAKKHLGRTFEIGGNRLY